MRSEKTEIPVILQLWLFEQRIALQMLVEEDIRKKCFAPYGLVNKTCRSEKKTEKETISNNHDAVSASHLLLFVT